MSLDLDEELEESLLWSDTEADTTQIDSNEEEELLLNGSIEDLTRVKPLTNGVVKANGGSSEISESLEKTIIQDVTISNDEVDLDITFGTRDMFDTSIECDSTADILNVSEMEENNCLNISKDVQFSSDIIKVDEEHNETYTWEEGDVIIDPCTQNVVQIINDPEVVIVTKDDLNTSLSEDIRHDEMIAEDLRLVSSAENGDSDPASATGLSKRVIESGDDTIPLPKRTKTTSCSALSPPTIDVSIRSRLKSAPQGTTSPTASPSAPLSCPSTPPLGSDIRPIPVDISPDSKPLPTSKPPTVPSPKPPKPLLPTPALPSSDKPAPNPQPTSTEIVSLNYSNYFKPNAPFVCRFCGRKFESAKPTVFENHIISTHAVRIVMKDFTVNCHDHYTSHTETQKVLNARPSPHPRTLHTPGLPSSLIKDFRSNIELRAGKYYCRPCKNIYVNESLIKEHLQGKKHKHISSAQNTS